MKALSIRIKTAEKKEHRYLVHDFRLYEPESLPSYIDPERTSANQFLIKRISPNSESEAKEIMSNIERENRELFSELKKWGYIAKNQGYKLKSHLAYGILTLSHEAQEELKDELKMAQFLDYARKYLIALAGALGTDIMYAVVHLDETAPHIHFAMRNLRVREPSKDACERLGLDYETMRKGTGKSITGTFYGNSVKAKSKRDYMVHYSQLQDTLRYFEPLGFTRGKPKVEREKAGEPYWKTINRSVRQLHEDLPKEIKLRERELRKKEEELRQLEESLKFAKKGDEEIKKELLREAREVLKSMKVKVVKKGVLKKEKYIPYSELVSFLDKYTKRYTERIAGHFKAVEYAKKEIEEAKQKQREAMEVTERAMLKVADMEQEIEQLETEKQELLDKIKELEAEVRNLRQERNMLRSKLKELEQEDNKPDQEDNRKNPYYRRPGMGL